MAILQPDRTARFMPEDVLVMNPHIGFTTFQRFNGDLMNPVRDRSWTEGFPIVYQPDRGTRHNGDHPDTTIAYFRTYWKFFEPEDGVYDFAMIDKALETADSRGQTLMLRIGPHGLNEDEDTPDWYRALSGDPNRGFHDFFYPTSPVFFERFTRMIRVLGERYDGDPRLDSVDMAVYGQHGEGGGVNDLPWSRRTELVDAYTDAFRKTPMMGLINAPDLIHYANRTRPVGWRADCLGDMGERWQHMLDFYPRRIAEIGDVWKKAPISFEICWVMYHWMDMGWDIDYIIDQSLKWHLSTFNAKSSPVPPEWKSSVDAWCKKMGYRIQLRFFDYPGTLHANDVMRVGWWIENAGVAPCYAKYPAVLHLIGDHRSYDLPVACDIRDLMPGESVARDDIRLPADLDAGNYSLRFAFTDPMTGKPAIRMPISGRNEDGWTVLGNVTVE